MKYLILSLAILSSKSVLSSSSSHDSICLNSKSVKVKWIAYKTAKKAGVGGALTDIKINKTKDKNIKSLLTGNFFTIDASSVNTKNPARDKKIAKFFFSTMDMGSTIKGAVKKIKGDYFTMALTMNGVTKDVPMKYSFKDNHLMANATIDVLDFNMHDELKALNKACFALHEGKTWSDVAIELHATTQKCN